MSKTTPHTELDEILIDFFNEAERDVHSENFINGTVITKAGTRAKAALTDYISREIAEVIDRIEQSVNQHTVPEGTGLATKSYIRKTLEFERQRAKAKGYDV